MSVSSISSAGLSAAQWDPSLFLNKAQNTSSTDSTQPTEPPPGGGSMALPIRPARD